MKETGDKNANKHTLNSTTRIFKDFFDKHGGKFIDSVKDVAMGAATFHPEGTVFATLNQKKDTYLHFYQVCSRPFDEHSDTDKMRASVFVQYQVLMEAKEGRFALEITYGALEALGITHDTHLIEAFEDNWKSPSLGAFGLGWEVRVNGIEVAQVTYMQKMCGQKLLIPYIELAFGIDRITAILSKSYDIDNLKVDEGKFSFIEKEKNSVRSYNLSCLAYTQEHLQKLIYRSLESKGTEGKEELLFNLSEASHHFNILLQSDTQINKEYFMSKMLQHAKKIAKIVYSDTWNVDENLILFDNVIENISTHDILFANNSHLMDFFKLKECEHILCLAIEDGFISSKLNQIKSDLFSMLLDHLNSHEFEIITINPGTIFVKIFNILPLSFKEIAGPDLGKATPFVVQRFLEKCLERKLSSLDIEALLKENASEVYTKISSNRKKVFFRKSLNVLKNLEEIFGKYIAMGKRGSDVMRWGLYSPSFYRNVKSCFICSNTQKVQIYGSLKSWNEHVRIINSFLEKDFVIFRSKSTNRKPLDALVLSILLDESPAIHIQNTNIKSSNIFYKVFIKKSIPYKYCLEATITCLKRSEYSKIKYDIHKWESKYSDIRKSSTSIVKLRKLIYSKQEMVKSSNIMRADHMLKFQKSLSVTLNTFRYEDLKGLFSRNSVRKILWIYQLISRDSHKDVLICDWFVKDLFLDKDVLCAKLCYAVFECLQHEKTTFKTSSTVDEVKQSWFYRKNLDNIVDALFKYYNLHHSDGECLYCQSNKKSKKKNELLFFLLFFESMMHHYQKSLGSILDKLDITSSTVSRLLSKSLHVLEKSKYFLLENGSSKTLRNIAHNISLLPINCNRRFPALFFVVQNFFVWASAKICLIYKRLENSSYTECWRKKAADNLSYLFEQLPVSFKGNAIILEDAVTYVYEQCLATEKNLASSRIEWNLEKQHDLEMACTGYLFLKYYVFDNSIPDLLRVYYANESKLVEEFHLQTV